MLNENTVLEIKNLILENIVLELKEFILENIVLDHNENAEEIAREVLENILHTYSFDKEIAELAYDSNEDWRKTFNRLREQAIKEIQSWL
jgi:hypothetical protein